ncbi:hypothetical protein KBD71_04505 [Candidatus Woesebacteria bacterium]|nr:hypothetical protein [Candidatus Woesebacteria bacterium]
MPIQVPLPVHASSCQRLAPGREPGLQRYCTRSPALRQAVPPTLTPLSQPSGTVVCPEVAAPPPPPPPL